MISLIYGIFKKQTNKTTHAHTHIKLKEIRFVVIRGRGFGEGKLEKVDKRYKLPFVRYISTVGVMCNVMTIVKTAI